MRNIHTQRQYIEAKMGEFSRDVSALKLSSRFEDPFESAIPSWAPWAKRDAQTAFACKPSKSFLLIDASSRSVNVNNIGLSFFYSNAHTCFLAHFSCAVWDFPNSAQFLLWKGSDIHNIRYILLITRQTYISPSFWVPHSALQEDTSPWHPTIWMSLPALREVQCVMQYFQFLQWYFTFLFVCHTVLLYYFHKHSVQVQPIQCVLLCGDRHSVRRSLIISLVSTNNQWLMAALIYRTIPNISKQ